MRVDTVKCAAPQLERTVSHPLEKLSRVALHLSPVRLYWRVFEGECRGWPCGYEQSIGTVSTEEIAENVKTESNSVFEDIKPGFVGSFTVSELPESAIAAMMAWISGKSRA